MDGRASSHCAERAKHNADAHFATLERRPVRRPTDPVAPQRPRQHTLQSLPSISDNPPKQLLRHRLLRGASIRQSHEREIPLRPLSKAARARGLQCLASKRERYNRKTQGKASKQSLRPRWTFLNLSCKSKHKRGSHHQCRYTHRSERHEPEPQSLLTRRSRN